MLTGIIDYNAGNLRSVINAMAYLEFPCRLVRSIEDTDGLEALILPGQGAFGDSIRNLRGIGVFDFVREWILADRPYFGICLGYQLLFEESAEAPGVEGLSVFKGRVVRFRDSGLKIPHMGWNSARPSDPSHPIWRGLGDDPYFYFVHSYFPAPEDPGIIGCRTDYGEGFASGVLRGNCAAFQFHPEKSQDAGLTLLRNFFAFVGAAVPSPV